MNNNFRKIKAWAIILIFVSLFFLCNASVTADVSYLATRSSCGGSNENHILREDLEQILTFFNLGKPEDFQIECLTGGFSGYLILLKSINHPEKSYVLKTDPAYSEDGIIKQQQVLKFLVGVGFPAAQYLEGKNGAMSFLVKGKRYTVKNFIHGETIGDINSGAKTLAEYYRSIEDFQKSDFVYESNLSLSQCDDWMRDFKAHVEQLKGARHDETGLNYDEIAPHFSFLDQQLEACKTKLESSDFDELPDYVIHGDFRKPHILFDKDQVSGVIDFDTMRYEKKIFEIVFAALSFCKIKLFDINVLFEQQDSLIEFFKVFGSNYSLSEKEIRLIPEIYRAIILQRIYCLPYRHGINKKDLFERSVASLQKFDACSEKWEELIKRILNATRETRSGQDKGKGEIYAPYTEFGKIIELAGQLSDFFNHTNQPETVYRELNQCFAQFLGSFIPNRFFVLFRTDSFLREVIIVDFHGEKIIHIYKDSNTVLSESCLSLEKIGQINIAIYAFSESLMKEISQISNAMLVSSFTLTQASPKKYSEKTPLKQSTEEYYYSERLDLFIQHAPFKITDPGVKEAANALGIKLWWDDEGRIGRISLIDTIRLFNKLGLVLMSPRDYWITLEEAWQKGDYSFVKELLSKRYAEWLNVLYFKSDGKYFMIEHPTINEKGVWEKEKDASRIKEVSPPKGRHAWFYFPDLSEVFDVIDSETGFPKPTKVSAERGKDAYTFKYWDIYTSLIDKMELAAIRGRVTSSDTPSFDCGMPPNTSDASMLMARPCRRQLLAPVIDSSVFVKLEEIMREYDRMMKKKDYSVFYSKYKSFIIDLITTLDIDVKIKLKDSQENSYIKIREKLADIIGFLAMYAMTNDSDSVVEINKISNNIFAVNQGDCNYDNFKSFVVSSKKRLEEALDSTSPKPVVFVMGHRNPDTDTVISSLFEAYRNQLMNSNVVYVPVVQGKRIPDEISMLLDDKDISDSILLTDTEEGSLLYTTALNSGQANWILVDQNISPVQKFVISILDHHTPSDTALRQDVAKTIEIVGSTTGMVLQRFYGMGLCFEDKMAKIAYGATLMDTENWSELKMTGKDDIIMSQIKQAAGISEGDDRQISSGFYQDLMSALLNTNDADLLFNRDYKEDWGFGFSVTKMKGVFNEDGTVNKDKQHVLDRLVQLAAENNRTKNLPLTIVKVVDYMDDNEKVRQERMYFEFSPEASPEFKRTMLDLFESILKTQYANFPLKLTRADNYFDWSGVGLQLSRKNVAPILTPVVSAFNEYFWSDKTKKYVCRDFLKFWDKGVQAAAKKLGIELFADENGNISYLTPFELMQLVKQLGGTILSPAEYIAVVEEAKQKNDVQLMESLKSHDFIEILDMVVTEYDPQNGKGRCFVHPDIVEKESRVYDVSGDLVTIDIPAAEPGLIDWDSVNPETGIPVKVYVPGEDIPPNVSLSRYWSPHPTIRCVFTRGTIFIYRIPCMDGKVKFDEKQPSVGVRIVRPVLTAPIIHSKIVNGHFIMEADSYSGRKIYCDGILLPVRDITEEINQELLEVDPNSHTLDAFGYVNNMCPKKFLDAQKDGEIGTIQIHYGPLKYVNEKNPFLLAGYSDYSLIDPDGCRIGWFIKNRDDGKFDVVITNVRGKSKLMHQLYALRFLGLREVSIYDYGFDYVGFAEAVIRSGMQSGKVESFSVGKSILERKLLRKIKFLEIFKAIKEDLKLYGLSEIKDLLRKQICDSRKVSIGDDEFAVFFNDPHALETLRRMQSILDEEPNPDDFLIYWQRYGDAIEDYIRLIKTINTGVIEITKFSKRLEASPDLNKVIVSEEGVVYYSKGSMVYRMDLSDIIEVQDNIFGKKKDIRFKPHVIVDFLNETPILKDNPEIRNGIITIFNFVKLFDGKLNQLKDYEKIPSLDDLQKKFNAARLEKDVFDIHLLSRPLHGDLDEGILEPVARYPFGTFAADFAEGAQTLGAKRYFHAGSCGVFFKEEEIEKWRLRRGDIVIPRAMHDKNGVLLKEINYENLVESARAVLNRSGFPYRILIYNNNGELEFLEGLPLEEGNPEDLINVIVTYHTSVDTPLEEDAKYVEFLKSKGMKSVDCETGKVVERMNKKGVELDYEFMFWVADVPGRKGEDLSREKEYMPILEETRFRKTQGIMSDMYLYLRHKEERGKRTDLNKYREMISPLNNDLFNKISNFDNAALIFLKGGELGGLNPVLKRKILEMLDSIGLQVVEGEIHSVSFEDMFNRWGDGYLCWHFFKRITDNKKLSNSFVYQLKKCIRDKDGDGFNKWIQEAKELALQDPELAMVLLVYEYYSSPGQYLLIIPKSGSNINTGEMTFQEYVKRKVVGETYAYRAKFDQLRYVVKGELEEGGSVREIMNRARNINPSQSEEFISSIFNAIHCPSRKNGEDMGELYAECISVPQKDIFKFLNLINARNLRQHIEAYSEGKPAEKIRPVLFLDYFEKSV